MVRGGDNYEIKNASAVFAYLISGLTYMMLLRFQQHRHVHAMASRVLDQIDGRSRPGTSAGRTRTMVSFRYSGRQWYARNGIP